MNTTLSLALTGSRFRIQLVLTILGGIGVPAIFLHFAWGTSPWSAILDKDLWRLAWPFFLSPLVTIALFRWLFSTALSRPERAIAYLVSVAVICVTLSIYVTSFGWPEEFREWLGFVFPFVILGFAAFAVLKTRKNILFTQYRAIMWMQIAYLANCLLCLSSFFGQWQIGAYCSLVTVVAYFTQTILLWRNHASQAETSAA